MAPPSTKNLTKPPSPCNSFAGRHQGSRTRRKSRRVRRLPRIRPGERLGRAQCSRRGLTADTAEAANRDGWICTRRRTINERHDTKKRNPKDVRYPHRDRFDKFHSCIISELTLNIGGVGAGGIVAGGDVDKGGNESPPKGGILLPPPEGGYVGMLPTPPTTGGMLPPPEGGYVGMLPTPPPMGGPLPIPPGGVG